MKRFALALALAAAVSACGESTDVAGGGSSGTGISSGGLSGFGSIIVNGVRYDVSNAAISADGRAISETDLRVGMIVRVDSSGSGSDRAAARVTYDADLRGVVESIDPATGEMLIFGQTVRTDRATVWKGTSLSVVAPGDLIEVSGRFQSDNTLRASFVGLKSGLAAGEYYEVKGYIHALDADASSFQLGTLRVDYDNASLPAAALHDGMFVDVKATQPAVGGVLAATEVEAEDDAINGEAGTEVELEGRVTRLVSAERFYLNGQLVRIEASTAFENGAAGDIVLDAELEVEGRLDASGELVAETVILRPESRLVVEGVVDAVDRSAGTVTVLGVTFRATSTTTFEDDSDAQIHRFGLAELAVGDGVEVAGYVGEAGTPVAILIERNDADTTYRLQGPVSAVSATSFTVLGIEVMTTADTDFGGPSQEEFFNDLAVGDYVDVRGENRAGSTLEATDAEHISEF